MDAGIIDTINRRDVVTITARLDALDLPQYSDAVIPWYFAPMSDTLLSEDPATGGDRAWLVGALAARTPGIRFDDAPADCDWENFLGHLRAEILRRRNPKTPHAESVPIRPCGVV